MFGGYVGQDRDKQTIKDLTAKLANDPNNLEIKRELETAKKKYQDTMDRALRSYSRI